MADEMDDFPGTDKVDVIHTLARAGISAIPVAGGPVAELLSLVIAPPLQQRRKQWFEELAARVARLEANAGISPEQLRENPAFIDAVLVATQAAIKTSDRDKQAALQNAILNSVLSNAPPPDLQQLYLSIVDTLSPWHIRFLYLFKDPERWFARAGKPFPNVMRGSLEIVIRTAFPETTSVDIHSLWRDLYARGLVNTESIGSTMTESGLRSSRTTDLGGEIVDFTINNVDLSPE